jgi:hypothetical protein
MASGSTSPTLTLIAVAACVLALGCPTACALEYVVVHVTVEAANVRMGPSLEHDVLFVASYGEQLTVLDRDNPPWVRVKQGGGKLTGWIHEDLVSVDHPGTEGPWSFAGFEYEYRRVGRSCYVYVSPAIPDTQDVGPILLTVVNRAYDAQLDVGAWPMTVSSLAGTLYVDGAGVRYGFRAGHRDSAGTHSLGAWIEKD